jgi:hypothetical protein
MAVIKTDKPDLKYVANHLPKTADPYLALLSKAEVTRARDFHRSFPQYTVTPLADLRHMAEYLGVARVAVKDESWRFGLNSFKVLGGSYAIGRFLAQEMGRDISELPYGVLVSDDPVAIDRACLDLVYASSDPGRAHLLERIESKNGAYTVDCAEALGIGSTDYTLITV